MKNLLDVLLERSFEVDNRQSAEKSVKKQNSRIGTELLGEPSEDYLFILNGLKAAGYKPAYLFVLFNLPESKRPLLYRAIKGGGRTDLRIAIARVLNVLPSKLWIDNSYERHVLDDHYYQISFSLCPTIEEIPELMQRVVNVRA